MMEALGDHAGVAVSFDQGMAVSMHVGHQFHFISAVVALHLADLVLDELRHEIMETGFDEDTCRALLASIVLGFLITTYENSVLGAPGVEGADEAWILMSWFADRPQILSLLIMFVPG